MKRSLSDFLQDILDSIAEIETFTNGVSQSAFNDNREKILAVVKLLEILGEAVKQIPMEKRSRYSSVNWRAIAGMRDIFVHEYWKVDVDIVWKTVQESIPALKAVVLEMIHDLD